MTTCAMAPAEPFASALHFLTTAEKFSTNNFNVNFLPKIKFVLTSSCGNKGTVSYLLSWVTSSCRLQSEVQALPSHVEITLTGQELMCSQNN
uniref:Uncharacterized protein n=1 Tax=Timema cristinae TaxID=61476 RepID=A0A7R9CZD7_TIMCR|nr:unnamed protein product [Timema cristinae]